jgi:hypothetical protein
LAQKQTKSKTTSEKLSAVSPALIEDIPLYNNYESAANGNSLELDKAPVTRIGSFA